MSASHGANLASELRVEGCVPKVLGPVSVGVTGFGYWGVWLRRGVSAWCWLGLSGAFHSLNRRHWGGEKPLRALGWLVCGSVRRSRVWDLCRSEVRERSRRSVSGDKTGEGLGVGGVGREGRRSRGADIEEDGRSVGGLIGVWECG